MAATTFYNVNTVTLCGVALAEVTSLSYDTSSNVSQMAVNGALHTSAMSLGTKTRNVTVTGVDPTTMRAAAIATGDAFFSVIKGCDDPGTETYYIADSDDSSASFGESFEYDSGGPGEIGTVTVTAVLTGASYATTEPT